MFMAVLSRCVVLSALLFSTAAARRIWMSYDDTLGSGQRPGVFGTDFRYYFENNTDAREQDNSSSTLRWSGLHNTTADIATSTPFLTKVTLAAGAVYPSGARGAAPTRPFFLSDDALYIVISGNVTFGDAVPPPQVDDDEAAGTPAGAPDPNSALPHGYGDVFWALGGQPHGPLRCVAARGSNCTFHVVTGYPGLAPRYGAPGDDNPSVIRSLARTRSYRRITGAWSINPSPHSASCIDNGGVYNMNFDAVNGTPPILRVRWAPNCSIPFHYHPTGAMYFILYGKMMFKGDLADYDTVFERGDVRWVRPGFDYGPEYNSADAPMEITVLGTDTPPTFAAAPDGPYKLQKTIDITHVFD